MSTSKWVIIVQLTTCNPIKIYVFHCLFPGKDVGELDLSSNNIRTIPPDIKKLSTLVHIDLSRNGIRCAHPQDFSGLPKEIASMPNLEILLLSECNLPFVPPAIWLCRNLKVLDISRNKINMLVPDIGNMERLQHLNAQQTSIIHTTTRDRPVSGPGGGDALG